MRLLLKSTLNISSLVNPFYLFCISFSFTFFVYLWRWSNIYPKLSFGLMLFFVLAFLIFGIAGYVSGKKYFPDFANFHYSKNFNDIILWVIIFFAIVSVIFMGYIPLFDRSHNYRDFGLPIINPLFNSLSIFFPSFFFNNI